MDGNRILIYLKINTENFVICRLVNNRHYGFIQEYSRYFFVVEDKVGEIRGCVRKFSVIWGW